MLRRTRPHSPPPGCDQHHRGLTLLETVIALLLIAVLLAILMPALASARQSSYRDHCASNQRRIGQAWEAYLQEHQRQFPFVPEQPQWFYGGVRFSSVDGTAFPDNERPLTAYLGLNRTGDWHELCVCCPADKGISDPDVEIGTGQRTVFRSFGTSYRANTALLDARISRMSDEARGMKRDEITTPPSNLVVMGDPVWFEVAEQTGRSADWHAPGNNPGSNALGSNSRGSDAGGTGAGNMLFLDGSVRFRTVRPKTIKGPVVFDPLMPGGSSPNAADVSATSPAASSGH